MTEEHAERGLWHAVILNALRDAQGTRNNAPVVQRASRLYAAQARNWLTSNSRDFVEVCALAGLDPAYVQQQAARVLRDESISLRAAPARRSRATCARGDRPAATKPTLDVIP